MIPQQLFVEGQPKGQPRPRAFCRGGHAAVYDPGTAECWKGQIAMAWKEAGIALPEGPYRVTLDFLMPRPKSHYTSKGEIKPTAPHWFAKKPDADNLAKAVLDCITSLQAWKDDSAVVVLKITKRYAYKTTGCTITIEQAL